MRLLELTAARPEEDLAVDEVLLETCERDGGEGVLRFYEPRRHCVVVGYGNHVSREVNQDACARYGVPILRRISGGGTVLLGPGCLAYALVLPMTDPELEGVSGTNKFVMERNRQALEGLLGGTVSVQGHTDLTLDALKFSGNSQRRRRRTVLFHGTFLIGMDLNLMEAVLQLPSQEPAYREGRGHSGFVTNLGVAAADVRSALAAAWDAAEPAGLPDEGEVAARVEERYGRLEWNLRRT